MIGLSKEFSLGRFEFRLSCRFSSELFYTVSDDEDRKRTMYHLLSVNFCKYDTFKNAWLTKLILPFCMFQFDFAYFEKE